MWLILQFACYLEDCKVLSSTHSERKDHAIKDHKFPHDFYDFKPVYERDFIPSTKADNEGDVDMESNGSMGSSKGTKKKTNHFQFGHKANKSFQSKSSRSKEIDMKDLMDVLPN